jgi:predicted homoserine dehydrogenase-like protein
MQPLNVPTSEVCAVAKKDLSVGERLDSIGEYTYRAWIMTVGEAVKAKAVPCGLIENGNVLKPIKKGELLTRDNIAIDESAKIVKLRKLQDAALNVSERKVLNV